MKEYKVANIGGGNLVGRFVEESKINELAKDGWVLMNVQQPPAVQNNRFVVGIFVRDAAAAAAKAGKSAVSFDKE